MGVNAFQHNAFQQTFDRVAFQEAVFGAGRYVSEEEVRESLIQKAKYQAGLSEIYKKIAAINLGRKGGLSYASTLSKKSR